MAFQYINGELHETLKIFNGKCSKCGMTICVGWKISKVIAHSFTNKEMARYCYDCTKNSWARSFKLFKEQMIEGKNDITKGQ